MYIFHTTSIMKFIFKGLNFDTMSNEVKKNEHKNWNMTLSVDKMKKYIFLLGYIDYFKWK